jgi:hypothetical protein
MTKRTPNLGRAQRPFFMQNFGPQVHKKLGNVRLSTVSRAMPIRLGCSRNRTIRCQHGEGRFAAPKGRARDGALSTGLVRIPDGRWTTASRPVSSGAQRWRSGATGASMESGTGSSLDLEGLADKPAPLEMLRPLFRGTSGSARRRGGVGSPQRKSGPRRWFKAPTRA